MSRPIAVFIDSSLVPGSSQSKHLGVVFWANVIACSFLLAWSILSTRIDSVDPGILSMARLLPPTYWAGFALLLADTIIWYFEGETKAFHFLLVALWVGYLFVGPHLMEAHPDGFSSYGQAAGVKFVLAGQEREFIYFPWLGFHDTFAMLTELTGISHLGMMRVGSFALFAILAAGLIAFFGRVLPDKKAVLVATLTALAMQAMPGTIQFTPHQMAFILMLFGLNLLAALDASPLLNRLTLIGLFFAIVITHGLGALVVVYVAAVAALAGWKRSTVGRRSRSTATLPLLFGIIFVSWLLYSTDFRFAQTVTAFRDTVLRDPTAFTSIFNPVSPTRAGSGRVEITYATFAFLAVLLAWFVSVVARRGFWNGLNRDRLFPLLVVSGLPVMITSTGNFSWEGLLRTFFYAGPFMAWFLAGESVAKRSTAVFLLLLLGLGFVLLYSREFEELPTSQQFAGANFLVEAARPRPNASVIQADCVRPEDLANTIYGPTMACPVTLAGNKTNLEPTGRDFTFIALSKFGEQTATFAFGPSWAESLRNSVQGEVFRKIYSNGSYDVFSNSNYDVAEATQATAR